MAQRRHLTSFCWWLPALPNWLDSEIFLNPLLLSTLWFEACLVGGSPACLAGLQGGLQAHTEGGLQAHTQEGGLQAHTQGGVSQRALRHTPLPTADGYCCGRYASYWNAFLFWNQIRNSDGIPFLCQITLMDGLVSAKFPPREFTFLVSGAFEWGQPKKLLWPKTRGGNDLDVLPHVHLFRWGGNFTSWARNKYVYYFVKLWIYPFLGNCRNKYQSLSNSFIHSSFSTLTGTVNEFTEFNKFYKSNDA